MGNTSLLRDALPSVTHGGSDGLGWDVLRGTTVPSDAATGYPKGTIFIKTNGGVATSVYFNEGSHTSADFNAFESAASSITEVIAGANLSGGGTEGAVTIDFASDEALALTNTLTVGVDDTGHDVKFFGATASKSWLWDESADKMIVTGASDLLGATQQTGTFTVGVSGTGHDVTFHGDTVGKSLLWDESADKLIVTGDASVSGIMTVIAGGQITSGVSSAVTPFIIPAAQQALSGAGAVNITTYYTTVDTSGGAAALTLANSTVIGQVKKIQMIADGGDGTLTPTSLSGGTTITFADLGDFAILIWNGTAWVAIELGNDADGVTAPVLG